MKYLILILFLLVGEALALTAGGGGFVGYGNLPSARTMEAGNLLLWGSSQATESRPEGNWPGSTGLVMVPLSWLELGGQVFLSSKHPGLWGQSLALKAVLKKTGFPRLAVGATDFAHPDHPFNTWYVVGGGEWKNSSFGLGFDFGSEFHWFRNPWDSATGRGMTPFLGLEMDFASFSLVLENTYVEESWSSAPSLYWKPLSPEPGLDKAWLSLGVGYQGADRFAPSLPDIWAGVFVQAPLRALDPSLRYDKDSNLVRSNEPWARVYLGPWVDGAFENPHGAVALGMSMDLVCRLGPRGLYWVNGLDKEAYAQGSLSLPQRFLWDRSYAQMDVPLHFAAKQGLDHLQVALGVLQEGRGGAYAQEQWIPQGWRGLALSGGALWRDGHMEPLVLASAPLHPKLPGLFRETQLQLEAGRWFDGADAAVLGVRQGLGPVQLGLGGGMRRQGMSPVVDFSLFLDASRLGQWRAGDVEFALSPRVGQASRVVVPTKAGAMPYLGMDGSSRSRSVFMEIPARWKGDSLLRLPPVGCDGDGINFQKVNGSQRCAQNDFDSDGIANGVDQCPTRPEDKDLWQDGDGCPDDDNDGDLVVDIQDKCPMNPEDRDGWQDEDGCPDSDNDGDGIVDGKDQCPNRAEDPDLFQDADGCPDEDDDKDGIADAKDKCPSQAETVNDYADEDGCPDADDEDGIEAIMDACPYDAEDPDGWLDEDGCPDPDNDHDGILDRDDKCPNKSETMNGDLDSDGCPDGPLYPL